MGIGGKWPPEKMSTKANGHWAIAANEHFGQMGVWDKWWGCLGQMALKACEDWDK